MNEMFALGRLRYYLGPLLSSCTLRRRLLPCVPSATHWPMEAFDSIDEALTPRQVANEWRTSLSHSTPTVEPIAPSDPHTVSFDDRLRTIVDCYTRLCALLSSKSSNASPMLNAFDDALSQVASVEASVTSLLALRGERAKTMLEAIQMVRE
jgi:hypothetical protein